MINMERRRRSKERTGSKKGEAKEGKKGLEEGRMKSGRIEEGMKEEHTVMRKGNKEAAGTKVGKKREQER